MARLKFRSTRPPGSFYYIQPESRLRIDGEDYGALMKKILSHRQYKGYPRATLPEVQEDAERQICSRLSKNECRSEGPDDLLRPVEESRVISISAVVGFSRAALEWVAAGRELIAIEEAKRRADICKSCPLMSAYSGCKCGTLYGMIARSVPAARRDDALGYCRVCSCELKSKVNLPESVILASNKGRNLQWPVPCFQREIEEKSRS